MPKQDKEGVSFHLRYRSLRSPQTSGNPRFCITMVILILSNALTIEVLCVKINSMKTNTFFETNLKRIRLIYGCSQRELAEISGVSLRSIQMYEQRQKDINKAQSDSLYRLAKSLGCTMEDLLERITLSKNVTNKLK